MKVVAYSIKPFEKEFLAKANQKKHDITLISNPLSAETAAYAEGKEAVIVFISDDVSAPVINQLADLGIKYIATRSASIDHIDKGAAAIRGIKIANVPNCSPHATAEHTVALALSLSRHLARSEEYTHNFDFQIDELIGFNFHGKTIGIVGLGNTGLATAKIFNGMGCHVIGYDVVFPDDMIGIEPVTFEELLQQSDVISLHTPLNNETKHIINKSAIDQMRKGVMLLNTSRGGLIDTVDALEALQNSKIGYLGLDVYEYEKGLFFEDHENDRIKDPLLEKLMSYPNVMITPHQAFLTKEALQQNADQTINNLDLWASNKCVGDACACAKNCKTVQPELPHQST